MLSGAWGRQPPAYGVSIIIPVYNDGHYLREAVDSVYAQDTDLPLQIIIVDDHSTDENTRSEIAGVLQDHPEIEFVRHDDRNRGLSAARNTGLKLAKHSFVFPLDVDNRLATDPDLVSGGRSFMDRCVEVLEADPDVMAVRCKGRLFDAVDRIMQQTEYSPKRMLQNNQVDAHAMYRLDEALAIGGYDEEIMFAEDWHFYLKMWSNRFADQKPAKVATVKDPVFEYRIRRDGSSLCQTRSHMGKDLRVRLAQDFPDMYQSYFPRLWDRFGHDPAVFADRLQARGNRQLFGEVMRYRVQLLSEPRNWGYVAGRLRARLDHCFERFAKPDNAEQAARILKPVANDILTEPNGNDSEQAKPMAVAE